MGNTVENTVIVLGVKKAHFEKEGDDIKYARLYAAFKDKGVVGQNAQEFKIEYQLADKLKPLIGKRIILSFNRFGKVCSFKLSNRQKDDDSEDDEMEADDDSSLPDDSDYPFPADDEP